MLAIIHRDLLSNALTRFHRGGYGHVIKVMDPVRSPVNAQLQRAGVATTRLGMQVGNSCVLLFVPAPARTTDAATIAHGSGAIDVELVHCGDPITWGLPATLQSEVMHRLDRRRPSAAAALSDQIAD
jgi:hypothetical protein